MQNKNADKMAAKMAIYYKNIRNSGKAYDFASKMLNLLILELLTSVL